MDQNADIVTQHLAEYLVNLGYVCPAPYGISELAFDHVESGLDVRSFMETLYERFPLHIE